MAIWASGDSLCQNAGLVHQFLPSSPVLIPLGKIAVLLNRIIAHLVKLLLLHRTPVNFLVWEKALKAKLGSCNDVKKEELEVRRDGERAKGHKNS